MKGAIALACAKIKRAPRSNITETRGNNQNFLRVFIKSHNSAIIDTVSPQNCLDMVSGSEPRELLVIQ